MASKINETVSLQIPQEISAQLSDSLVSVSGPKGKASKNLALRGLTIKIEGSTVTLTGPLREVMTANGHISNMLKGCKEGYSQNMKIIFAHFPMSLEIKGKALTIKNFKGERKPRTANIVGDTKVEIKGQSVVVSGPSKDDVGQTVANLRIATKIVGMDSRIFQDGIYPVKE